MRERQGGGMQPLTLQAEPISQRGIGAVSEVPDTRVTNRGHVNPDLVSPPSLQLDLEQARSPKRLDRLVMGHARPATGDDRPFVVVGRVPSDRRIDGAAA